MENKVTSVESFENGLFINTQSGCCRISFLTERILRVRFAFEQTQPPKDSYAVILRDEPYGDSFMSDEYVSVQKPDVRRCDGENTISLICGEAEARIDCADFSLNALYKGKAVHRDIRSRAYTKDKNDRRRHTFALDGFTAFYGLGEKSGELNKLGRRLRMYTCDTLGYNAKTSDPLYKHIPFFIKRDPAHDLDCGIFYDCTENAVIDLGCERSGYWDKYAYFCCDGGEIDYYVIFGDRIKDVVAGYTQLTGRTAMPTLQSIGYLASTMYYTELDENADKAVEGFIEELDSQGFPCDGFHMSSGYTSIKGKRYVFNWNNTRFPSPEGFAAWMKRRRIPVSPNVKPAMLTDHPRYKEFAEAGAFLTDSRTGGAYLERYWGGMASLIDFTSESGRAMWKRGLREALFEKGFTCIWDDNNEYEISDEAAVCHPENSDEAAGVCATALKPAFSNLMAKTGVQALKEFNASLRPFILSRSGYAGIQRYAQTWCGDNYTSWESLKYGIPIMLGMGLSGVANNGCDIGGFQGSSPDAELFTRWVQNGIFQPRFCIHSCNTDNTVTQPWSYASFTPYIREAFKLRYALGLYTYSLMRRAATAGEPVMRPLVYEFEADPKVQEESFDFMYGPFLLVANVVEQGAETRSVYLPAGASWYDWHTGARYEGGQTVTVPAPISTIPMFFRSGCMLPLIAPARHMRLSNLRSVRLLMEISESSDFTLYQDDGESNRYHSGDYLETKTTVVTQNDGVTVNFSHNGSFASVTEDYELEAAGRSESPLNVTIDGKRYAMLVNRSEYDRAAEGCWFDLEKRRVLIKFKNPKTDFSLNINYSIKDLIGM